MMRRCTLQWPEFVGFRRTDVQRQVEKLVTQSFRDREVDLRREEVDEISGVLVELSAVETWETLAPDRFISECVPLMSRPCFAVDLGVKKKRVVLAGI